MPIIHDLDIKTISKVDFHSIDYKVMGLAFAIHRELGRFWNETIYKNLLACRCREDGFKVATEIPIRVSFKDFCKIYYADLLIDNAVIYELKTAQAISGEHKKQILNYLLLLGMQRGKLVNMQPSSVEHLFVSTRITPEHRYSFIIDDLKWINHDKDSEWLRELMINLLEEWGAFLGINLFYDAIYHFRGGEEKVIKKIEIRQGIQIFGMQKIHILNSEVAFKITAITKGIEFYEKDLCRFIQFASIKVMHWINFDHERIVFKTITK